PERLPDDRRWPHRSGSAEGEFSWLNNRETDSCLQLGQHDSLLRLVFAFAVSVAGLAGLIGLEEEDLAQPFVGIDFGRKRRCVRDLEGDEALPLRLEGSDVHDDAATRIRRLAYAYGQNIAGDLEILDGARKGEGVGRNQHAVRIDAHEGALVESLRIDDGGVDVSEDLEL